MPNVWGEPEGNLEGVLTNPLTEDLQGNGYNAFDFNEVHLNELHDNSGTGKIVVHEELNMTNSKISNLADPTNFKDAVNIDYLNSRLSSFSVYQPYDLYVACGDETSPMASGTLLVKFQVPRNFRLTELYGFLSIGVNAYWTITLSINGVTNNQHAVVWNNPGDTASDTYVFPSPVQLVKGDVIEFVALPADSLAAGLKMVLHGEF